MTAAGAYAELARALARYADASPPSVDEVRRAVAAIVAAHPASAGTARAVHRALERCVCEHAPPQLDESERRALVTVLARWAADASRLPLARRL